MFFPLVNFPYSGKYFIFFSSFCFARNRGKSGFVFRYYCCPFKSWSTRKSTERTLQCFFLRMGERVVPGQNSGRRMETAPVHRSLPLLYDLSGCVSQKRKGCVQQTFLLKTQRTVFLIDNPRSLATKATHHHRTRFHHDYRHCYCCIIRSRWPKYRRYVQSTN